MAPQASAHRASTTVFTNVGFEGTVGRVAASVMARLNRDVERSAVAELDPSEGDDVLAVGFGPGVGIQELVERLTRGCVAGIDPSSTMVELARRRNRRTIDSGQVVLVEAAANNIPFPNEAFRGVVAVNCMQLWRPLEGSLREVARVLVPGGRMVAVTHVWALQKHAPLDEWLWKLAPLLSACGLGPKCQRTEPFRSGAGLVLSATKPGRPTPKTH